MLQETHRSRLFLLYVFFPSQLQAGLQVSMAHDSPFLKTPNSRVSARPSPAAKPEAGAAQAGGQLTGHGHTRGPGGGGPASPWSSPSKDRSRGPSPRALSEAPVPGLEGLAAPSLPSELCKLYQQRVSPETPHWASQVPNFLYPGSHSHEEQGAPGCGRGRGASPPPAFARPPVPRRPSLPGLLLCWWATNSFKRRGHRQPSSIRITRSWGCR